MVNADTLYAISGDKINALLMTDEALLFLGKKVSDSNEFQAAWDKKLSVAEKTKVAYEAIRSVTREQEGKTVMLRYRALAGLPGEQQFSFEQESDYEAFFQRLEKQHYFVREEVQLSPLKAALGPGIAFVAVAVATYFLYYLAQGIADGTAVHSSRGRTKLLEKLLEFLGPNGTLIVGLAICLLFLYRVLLRYRNPPVQVKLTRR
ncbi:MAG: hypothetical protein EOP50_13865 [Sphingobacteriales bacterium]|nr:MAG: hypothetical protein EOP50_13865 [Sphingobacteriales bacterium]